MSGPFRQLVFSMSVKYTPVDVGVEMAPTGDCIAEPAEGGNVGLDVARLKAMMSGSPSLRERSGLHARRIRSNPTAAITKYLLGIMN